MFDRKAMGEIWRAWWPILAAITLLQTGNGLTGTLISVTSEAQGFAPWLKGLVLSAFYAGSLAGALAAPTAIARSSHITAFAGFAMLLSAATAGYSVSADPLAWSALRFAAGFGISGAFAVVESWLNLSTANERRARVFSIYIMVQLGGLALGQLLLNARAVGNEILFFLAAGFSLIAVACLRFERVQNPHYEPPTKLSLRELARRSPFGVAAVALSGFAWAALMASGPALVELIGFSDFAKSMFMIAAIVSGMVAQFPLGSLADRMDRRRVLALKAAAAAIASLAGLAGLDFVILIVFAVTFGAATLPLYAIGVARVNERLQQSERTAASAGMIAAFLIGAFVAPPIFAYATALFGPQAYFVLLAIPHAAFALLAVLILRSRVVQSS